MKKLLLVVGIGLGVLILFAGVAYAVDAPVEATIREKDCLAVQPTVSIVTELLGIPHTLKMTQDKCSLIQKDNFVRYHLRSGHTTIFASKGGACVFDSVTIACW